MKKHEKTSICKDAALVVKVISAIQTCEAALLNFRFGAAEAAGVKAGGWVRLGDS